MYFNLRLNKYVKLLVFNYTKYNVYHIHYNLKDILIFIHRYTLLIMNDDMIHFYFHTKY